MALNPQSNMKFIFGLAVLFSLVHRNVQAEQLDSLRNRRVKLYMGYHYWSGIRWTYDQQIKSRPDFKGPYSIFQHNIAMGLTVRTWKQLHFNIEASGFYSERIHNFSYMWALDYGIHKNVMIGIGMRRYTYERKNVEIMVNQKSFLVDQYEAAILPSLEAKYFFKIKKVKMMVGLELPLGADSPAYRKGGFHFQSNSEDFSPSYSFINYPFHQVFRTFNFSLLIQVL